MSNRATPAARLVTRLESRALAKDLAAGLDLFVHVPSGSPSGGLLPVQVPAFGFPAVTTLQPVGGFAPR